MKKDTKIQWYAYLLVNLAWSIVLGFALVDYFLPNLPFWVHWFSISFVASVYSTFSEISKYFVKHYKELYVE